MKSVLDGSIKTLESSGKQDWTDKLISALSRLAVLGLVVYLVQILVNLYRYNMRLSAFYDARADALVLLTVSGNAPKAIRDGSITHLAVGLSPEALDFGQSPQTPIQSALDLAKEVIKAAKPTT